MVSQPGITSPQNFAIRSPMDSKQKNGRVVNPVRYGEMGGASGPRIWATGSDYHVQAPTSVSAAKSAGGTKIGR